MLKKWLYLLGLLFLNKVVFSQSSLSANLASLAPVSPNVASLGKYAEIPVGYHTGIPQISIPLYEIKVHNLSLPVSLSYHASGIKVEEVASSIGLGWSLNAGGVISRTVRGLPDETTDGYFYQYSKVNSYINGSMSEDEKGTYVQEIGTNKTDAQPDIFNYNFGSYSGQFFVAQDGKYYAMPRNNLLFERFTDGVGNYWRVTTEDGTKYNFTLREYNASTATCTVSQSIPDNTASQYETSWFLTSIISADNADTVTFSYNSKGYNFLTNHTETGYLRIFGDDRCTSNSRDKCTLQNRISSWCLSRISFPNGHLDVTYNTTDRQDLSGDTAVQSIAVYNNQGDQIKKYNLGTSYFTANNSCSSDAAVDKRLRLDNVQEIAASTDVAIAPYQFTYYGTYNIPCRLSNSQDYWGYYNGQSNTTLVPSLFYPDGYGSYYTVVGADRSIDTTLTKSGTLQTISYPTGGTATFDYENNTVAYLSTNFEMLSEKDTTFMVAGHASDEAAFQSTTFTLGAVATGYVSIASDCVSDGTIQSNSCAISITLTWPDGTVAVLTNGQSISLDSGTYTLRGYFLSSSDASQAYSGTLSLKEFYSVHQSTIDTAIRVGGLRISRIIKNDGTKDYITRFKYSKFDDDEVSSGTAINYPVYYYLHYIVNRISYAAGDLVTTCTYYAFSSTSQYPLTTTNGSHVGYSNVQIFDGDESGPNGKTQLTYTSAKDYPDDYSGGFPFAPPCSYEWKRGLLIKEEKFVRRNNAYWPVERKVNNYTFYDSDKPVNRISVPGIKAGVMLEGLETNTYLTENFNTVSEWFVLSSDETKTYSTADTNKYVQTTNTYEYNTSHLQLAKQTTNTSDGGVLVTHLQYPGDYQNLTATDDFTAGVKNLQNNHIINAPIEQFRERDNVNNTNTRIVNGVIRSFKADKSYPDKVWQLEPTNPAGTTFFSSKSQNGSILKSDFYEQALSFNSYDSKGNVTNQQKTGDMPISYIWDYNNEYPVAEIKNAALQDVAYTSFEADGAGGWDGIGSTGIQPVSASLTGKKYYSFNGTGLTKTGLTTASTYIVSYWSRNGAYTVSGSSTTTTGRSVTVGGSTWTFYQHTVTGVSTITVAGSGAIDELRLYPAAAQMTTYTFTPLIGVSAQCDVANRVSYYEYDGLNRLKLIRDQNNNIIKTMDYHYHGN